MKKGVALWRSLRFGDNLQAWVTNKNTALPQPLAGKTRTVRINNENEYCQGWAGCVIYRWAARHVLEVAAPEQPITINMNVKIEHEIHIKVDKDVEELLKSRSDLFLRPPLRKSI